ncbi:MAG: hypothetical protein L3J49_06725 [Desulfobulbaceae bacterium]|nr:hypothetical protein [Desulfobulbaceae bacterium]
MTIAFFILITASIVAYSLAPLLRREERWLAAVESGTTRKALEAEKTSYLRAMKDIEFEHASNKINDQDYAELRKHYGAKAAKIIRDLEQLGDTEPVPPPVKVEKSLPAEGQRQLVELGIAEVREKMDRLEQDWDTCTIDDDEYIRLHDEYTLELETILEKLDKEKVQG